MSGPLALTKNPAPRTISITGNSSRFPRNFRAPILFPIEIAQELRKHPIFPNPERTLITMTIPLTLRRASAASHRRPRHAAGFTLTEILIAIALIVIIVGVAVANLTNVFSQGQSSTAHLFVTDSVKLPLMNYRMNTGHFPTTDEGLQALITAPDGETSWHGPYLDDSQKTVPLDPWGHPYQYMSPGTHNPTSYDVWSVGPDGQNGTADDVGNWGD